MGASYLALKVDSSPATIGRVLQRLDYEGYLKKHGNKGRSLTKKGVAYLQELYRDCLRDQHSQEFLQDDTAVTLKYIQDVLDVRKVLEREIVSLVVRNITDKDIIRLKQIMEEHDQKIALGLPGDEEDLKFHTYLAGLSGNDVMVQLLHMILYHRGVYSILTRIRKNTPSPLVVEHKKIVAALEERNEKLVAASMVAHIDSITRDVQNLIKKGHIKEL